MGGCGGGADIRVVIVVVDRTHFIGNEYAVSTGTGKVSVTDYGDPEKPGLITYPDMGVNCRSSCNKQGRTFTAGALADQILEVPNYFKLVQVMCMGLTAFAHILMLFVMKYRDQVLGLILISPLCKSTSWPKWFYNKREARGSAEVPELGVVQAGRRLLGENHACEVWRRHDLTRGLKSLTRRTLIFVGGHSPFISDARHMSRKLGKKKCTLVEVQACGSMVTEEQQLVMQVPSQNFLMKAPEACLTSVVSPPTFSHLKAWG